MSHTIVKKDRYKLKASPSDVAHTLIKAGISAIPIIGGPAAELFSAIIISPLSKRRDEWIASIATALKELEEKVEGFRIESLSQNDVFITTVMHATQIAIRNHQAEKLMALRNAVLNTALSISIDENTIMIFLNLIDAFTPWHLKILQFFESPTEWARSNGISFGNFYMGAPSDILEQAFPELRGKREFYDKIVKDLYSQGMMSIESLHGMMTFNGMIASRTTNLGNQFLAFIREPKI